MRKSVASYCEEIQNEQHDVVISRDHLLAVECFKRVYALAFHV
jgi:hypothetical protein